MFAISDLVGQRGKISKIINSESQGHLEIQKLWKKLKNDYVSNSGDAKRSCVAVRGAPQARDTNMAT